MRSRLPDGTRLHLELGGNSPVIVHGDADVCEAAELLGSIAQHNAGQGCTAPSRMLVHDEFVSVLASVAASAEFGPVNNPAQLARLEDLPVRLPSHARVAIGGSRQDRPGRGRTGGRDGQMRSAAISR